VQEARLARSHCPAQATARHPQKFLESGRREHQEIVVLDIAGIAQLVGDVARCHKAIVHNRFSLHEPQGKNWVGAEEAEDNLREAAGERIDDALKVEQAGATMQYLNSYIGYPPQTDEVIE
jgi:hypothetical protein